LAQAFVLALYSITSGLKPPKNDSYEQHHVGKRAWVLALGLLHLMSSILTLASFGLSSVSETYIIRTLEPICSCLLLYFLHGQKRTPTEQLLLAVVAGATAAVVLAGPQPDKGLLPSNASEGVHASQYHASGTLHSAPGSSSN
jgi:drug/metabolite transporter (DMT)-like permease